jgi:hypothetical protein
MDPPPPSDSTELAEVLRRDRRELRLNSPQRHKGHEEQPLKSADYTDYADYGWGCSTAGWSTRFGFVKMFLLFLRAS